MQNKAAVWMFFGAALAAFGQAVGPAGTEAQAPPPLVRRSLVRTQTRSFPPVKRDLFTIQSFAPATGAPVDGPGFVTRPPEKPAGDEAPPPPEFAVRYVGYIVNQARTKVVGLVMVEGQMAAVEAGDVIGRTWKVVSVTAEAVAVEGPEGKTLAFAFEGERR